MKMRWVPSDELSPQTLRASDYIKPEQYIDDAPPKQKAKRAWFYAPTYDCEDWGGGPFNTEEEAIAEGRVEYTEDPPYGEPKEEFGVMEAEEVLPDDVLCNTLSLADVLEYMEDHVIDQCMNSSNDGIFSVNKDYTKEQAEEALHALLGAWARKYLHCHWYNGLDTKEVSVEPEED